MSAASEVINHQNVAELSRTWKVVHLVRKDPEKGRSPGKLLSGDASSSSDELNTKIRKPYTITKQRERWTETEHQKFLEALKLYGRAWRRIEEYVGTKTAVQIRSHAQKFFFKLEREASTGSSAGKLPEIAIPPPRPKRKPNHPYPRKAGSSPPVLEDESKEALSTSSAGLAAAPSEGFQSGALGSNTGTFLQTPLFHGHSFGPEGSVKIFGKTVVVPQVNKQNPHNEMSNNCLASNDNAFLGKQTSVAKPKQIVGFSPFIKVRKSVDSLLKAPLQDRTVSTYSGATTQSADTGESLGRVSECELAGGDNEAADKGECKARGDASLQKMERGIPAVGLKEAEKLDIQFPQVTDSAMQSWMTNFLHYPCSVSIPPFSANGAPFPANGVVDGSSSSSLSYWQLMQASAVNYAAYTAAMAAAAAAGWKRANPGGTDLAELVKSNTNEPQMPSVPSPWYPYRGIRPSVYFPPAAGVLHEVEALDSCENAEALKNERIGVCQDTPPQGGQPDPVLKAAEIAEVNEAALKVDGEAGGNTEDHTKANSSANRSGSKLETSCITEASGNAKACLDSESQLIAEAISIPLKFSTRGSDTETRVITRLLHRADSSSDELEEQGKKLGEGSSSGSNTPASRYQSSECDALVISETKKRDSDALFEDNDDEGLRIGHQHCVDLPKLRLKHVEKGKKIQQRDARHGGWCDDSKRFKSCAHDLEFRKEVSQEGRKAFQALFTSKLLPQTFPSANLVSRPSVFTGESRLNECIKFSGVSQGKRNGVAGYAAVDVEMGNEFQGLKGQFMVNKKVFTVSSSSGFVPYRRLVCPEPVDLDQSCSR